MAVDSASWATRIQVWQDVAVAALAGPPLWLMIWTTATAGIVSAACALCGAGRGAKPTRGVETDDLHWRRFEVTYD